MKTFKMLGMFILSLNASMALAQKGEGYGMGNGGDAVVCYTDATRSTITSVEMFDYWEQQQVQPFGKIDLGPVNFSVQDKIQIAVDRINKFDPELAKKIKFHALNLANNIQSYLVTSYQLPEIDDMTPQVIPTKHNCFIEQYGVQYKDVITGQKRFYIADKFYNFTGISNDNKAGLLLHEAIYRYAILQKPALDNSDGVRYLNYVIASMAIDNMSTLHIDEYVKYLRNAGIENIQCRKSLGLFYVGAGNSTTCYNQTINLGTSVNVYLPHGSNFETNHKFGDSIDSFTKIIFESLSPFIIENPTVKIDSFSFKVEKYLELDLTKSKIQFDIYGKHPSYLYLTNGPANLDYKCDNGLRYDYKAQTIQSCMTSDVVDFSGQSYEFGEIQPDGPNRWKVKNKNYAMFSVWGSQKNLQVILDNLSLSTIDVNLKALEGNVVRTNSPLDFNGFKYQMTAFKILKTALGNTIVFNTAKAIFNQPKFKGLRLINNVDSTNGTESFFCSTNGYDRGNYYLNTEYVNGTGESFYEVNSKSVIYKTDELVRYIDRIDCNGKENLKSADY